MAKKKKYVPEDDDFVTDYSLSFADVFSAIIGVFLILMVFFMTTTMQEIEMLREQQDETSEEEMEIRTTAIDMIGVRKEIVENIKKAFEDSGLDIMIENQTGAIRLSDNVLFEYDSHFLTQRGREYLDEFVPRYFEVIVNERTRPHLSEIIIEGHTDDTGSYLYNLDLSQRRSSAVVQYILSEEIVENNIRDDMRDYIMAVGRSFSNLIYDENDNVDREASRRVEFKFRLKDEDMLQEIGEMLSK